MGKILKLPATPNAAKPRIISKPAKTKFDDQNAYFMLQMAFLFVLDIHHIVSNLVTFDTTEIYIAAALGMGLQAGCVCLWNKKKFLTPFLMIVSLTMYNWCHFEVLRADYDDQSSQYIALEALPMSIINLVTIQNLPNNFYRAVAIVIWMIFSILVSFDAAIAELIPLLSFTIIFIFINFTIIRKRTDYAVNAEYKLTKTVEKLKGLLDVYVNDGIAVVDVFLKDILFSNMCFQRVFDCKDTPLSPSNQDIRHLFSKILVKEEEARKDEHVYLCELLDALRENFLGDAYETCCQYQMENNDYKMFSVKISQCYWDNIKGFVLVFTDISQREILKELRAHEETQNHLMDIFAHELRTPIKNILGALGLLVRDIPQEQKDVKENPRMKYLYICQLSCKYLQSICNSFLDVARMKHNALKINVASFSLRKLMQEVKDMLECQTNEKGLRFELEIFSDVPDRVINDRDKLEEILLNLLTNAIKFTVTGFVKMQVKLDNVFPDSIELSIIDSGTGIGQADRTKLFKTFANYQAPTSITGPGTGSNTRRSNSMNPDGVGLGLSISQKLTRALAEADDTRGIRVESIVGRGTKFTFSITAYRKSENHFIDFQHPMLPDEKEGGAETSVNQSYHHGSVQTQGQGQVQKVKTVPKQPRLIQRNNVGSSPNFEPASGINELYIEKTNSVLNSVQPTSFYDAYSEHHGDFCTTPITTRACVLVVDDNPVDLMLICEQLEAFKIPYRTALGGEACLDQVDEAVRLGQPFRGILLDCYMADLNGFQTAKILRARMKRREIPEIPLIAISAHDNPENREKAFKAGIGAWYTKPLQDEDIREMLETSFGKNWRAKTEFDREV